MEKSHDKQKVSMKDHWPTSLVCAMLRQFADGLEKGQLILEQDGNKVELSVPKLVEAKVSGRRKTDKEKFTMELSWRSSNETQPITINKA